MLINVAGLCVRVENECSYLKALCRDYTVKDGSPELSVVLPSLPPNEQSIYLLREVSCAILEKDGFLIHSSAISFDGKGILFTALSGTGKSTHTRFWKSLYKEKVVYVNDDKPVVRMTENGAFVYGTPWCGKHRLQTNISVPVRALVFLKRGAENSIKPVSSDSILPLIFDQIYRPSSPSLMEKQLSLLDGFLSSVNLFELYCKADEDAARVAFEGLKGVLK